MAKKKSKTKAEKLYMQKVAELGCIACEIIGFDDTPANLHHVRDKVGAGQKASHYDVIPLCRYHHQDGPEAFHRSKLTFEKNFGTEKELLKRVKESLGEVA